MPERIILHLDMNAFFASVEQRANPRLRGQPVFVCGNRHSRTVVATASYEARAVGVKTGMPLQEALALCPSAILIEGNPEKYADTFRQVARLMEQYSPALELFSIDEAFLDLTDTAERFGGAWAVAEALQRQVHEQVGLPCSIGLGSNKLLAKLASSMGKPNGITPPPAPASQRQARTSLDGEPIHCVRHGGKRDVHATPPRGTGGGVTQIRADEVAAVLHELPIEELCGIGPALTEALNAQGIRTCGQLSQVPVARLIRQFGRCAGLHLARLARGLDDSPVIAAAQAPAAKSMGHLQTLSHDTDDPALIRVILLGLAEKVGRRLRAEQAAGCTVTLTLRYRDFTTFSRAQTLDRFLDDGFEIYHVGCQILERLRLAQSVRMIGISVSNLSYEPRQGWWLPEMKRRSGLLAACDRINDRFGEGTVTRAALLEPEAQRHYQLKRDTARSLLMIRCQG